MKRIILIMFLVSSGLTTKSLAETEYFFVICDDSGHLLTKTSIYSDVKNHGVNEICRNVRATKDKIGFYTVSGGGGYYTWKPDDWLDARKFKLICSECNRKIE